MNGKALDAGDPAIPCGLVAKSVFNDTYELYGPGDKKIDIDVKNIAWTSDIQYKFKNIQKSSLPSGKDSYKDV